MREIVINAIVHNDYYTNEVPPKFEIFSDRIEITSAGRLPIGMTKEEFLIGLNFSSKTRRLEEWQIGQKSTGKDVQKSTGKDVQKSTGKKLGKTAGKIVELMRVNPNVTIPELAESVHTK